MIHEKKLAAEVNILFAFEDGELGRESWELDKNCRSRWYRWCRLQLDTYLKLVSLKLKEEPVQATDATTTTIQGFDDARVKTIRLQVEDSSSAPPRLFGRSKLVRTVWRYARPLCRLLLVYFMVKFNLIAYLAFMRDTSLKQWRPKLRPNATHHGPCILANETRLENPAIPQSIERYNGWIDLLGNPWRELVGTPILVIQFMTCFTWNLYLSGQLAVHWMKPRLDYMNFVLNPHGERERISRQLDEIVDRLALKVTGCGVQKNSFHRNYSKNPTTKFLKLLVACSRLVRPANLTPKYHKSLLRLCSLYTPLMVFSQIAGLGSSGMTLLLELVVRAAHRSNKMECQRWQPNGVLIKEPNVIGELRRNSDVAAYVKLGQNSIWNFFELSFRVEYKFLITTLGHLLFCLELFIFMLFICIVFPTYELLYLCSVYDKIKWLRQLEEQLNCCIHLSDYINRSRLRRRVKVDEGKEELTEVESKFVECLATTYLNNCLFNSQQRAFLESAQIFIPLMISGSIYMILLSYFVTTYTEMLFARYIVLGIVWFVIQVNLYLLTGALFLSRAKRRMRNILKLIGMAGDGGDTNRKMIIDLWRHQLLKPEDLEKTAGVVIVGWPLTYRFIVEVNFYFILICFLQVISENRLK